MKTEIARLSKSEYKLWDDFVDAQKKSGTLFHSSEWLCLFNDKPDITAIIQEGNIIGGSALAKIKKYGIKGYHALPFTPCYGILISDELYNNTEGCIEITGLILDNLPASHVYDFLLPSGHQNIHPYIWRGFDASVYITHIIKNNIASSAFSGMISKGKKRDLQTVVKLYDKGELKILKGNDSELKKEMINLVKESSKRIGYNNPEWAFNKLMTFQNPYFIAVFHDQHGIISGNILFEDQYQVYNLFNGSKRIKDPKLGLANVLNMNESILYALNKNKSFDFEGSMLKGVEKFYRSMGGEVIPRYRLIKSGSLFYNAIRFLKYYLKGRKE